MKLKAWKIILLIFVISLFFININNVQAAGISDVISGGDSFIEAGRNQSVLIDNDKMQDASNTVYNMLLVIGMCAAVLISCILGIQFMIGSVEEKAKVKDALIPFIIGCIVIFGAFGIWKIFVDIGNSL